MWDVISINKLKLEIIFSSLYSLIKFKRVNNSISRKTTSNNINLNLINQEISKEVQGNKANNIDNKTPLGEKVIVKMNEIKFELIMLNM